MTTVAVAENLSYVVNTTTTYGTCITTNCTNNSNH